MGFIGIGAVFAIACIGVGSLLATERKKTVWIAGLVTVALTALGAAVLNGL